jgi:ATP-dependent DNA ligase
MGVAFPEIVPAVAALPGHVTLDAELVVPTAERRSDFEELRRRALLQRPRAIAEAAKRMPALLLVFDILHAAECDLRALPLHERRTWLLEHVAPSNGIQIIEQVPTHGEALFRAIAEHDQEGGIVAKRLDAPYRAGRQPTWLKIKNQDYSRREALVFHHAA